MQKIECQKIDRKISRTVLIYIVILLSQFLLRSLTGNREGIISEIIKVSAIIIQGFIYISTFKHVVVRKGVHGLLVYLLVLFILLINMLIYEENIPYLIKASFFLLLTTLPAYIYTLSIKDINIFYDEMKKISNIATYLGILLLIFTILGSVDDTSYSSGLSYYLLFPIIVQIDSFIDHFSLLNLVKISLLILLLLFLGARGPFLSILIFIFMRNIKNIKRYSSFKKILFFSLPIVGILSFNFIENILLKINYLGNKYFNINSRTITLLLNDLSHSSGRNTIYRFIIQKIDQNPIAGIGLAGDRTLLGGFGLYSHNIFLELFSSFGLIIGSIISLYIITLLLRSLIYSNDRNYKVIAIWISLGFIPLLFSGSFLQSISFWIMLGIISNPNNYNKEKGAKLYE